MTSERTDTFVVGPIIEDTMPLLMIAPPGPYASSTDNLRFINLLTKVNSNAIFNGQTLSNSIFRDLNTIVLDLLYITVRREQEPIIENGRITHYYSFRLFLNRSLSNFVGYLQVSSGILNIVNTPQTITLYTNEPAIYQGYPLVASINYRIDTNAAIERCSSAYNNTDVGNGVGDQEVPLFNAIDDLLNTDLEDRYADYNPTFGFLEDSDEEDLATTNWCNGTQSVNGNFIEFFFIPTMWYNQGSCIPSRLSSSMMGFNSFYPASAYLTQCFADNNDVFNTSRICNNARQLVGYTTQDSCVLYSSVGRFFYGPNRTSPESCGASGVISSTLMNYPPDSYNRDTMVATSTVGACSTGACVVNNQALVCSSLIIDPDIEEPGGDVDIPSEEVETQWWKTQTGIIAIAILAIVILIIILIVAVVLTKYNSKKKRATRRVVITKQVQPVVNPSTGVVDAQDEIIDQEIIEQLSQDVEDQVDITTPNPIPEIT